MTINDGGPAFPRPSGPEPRVNATTDYNDGMSLRDWFAGQVLAHQAHVAGFGSGPRWDLSDVAAFAYEAADAMLAARESKERQ